MYRISSPFLLLKESVKAIQRKEQTLNQQEATTISPKVCVSALRNHILGKSPDAGKAESTSNLMNQLESDSKIEYQYIERPHL